MLVYHLAREDQNEHHQGAHRNPQVQPEKSFFASQVEGHGKGKDRGSQAEDNDGGIAPHPQVTPLQLAQVRLNVGGAVVRFVLEQGRGLSVHFSVRHKINVLYLETSPPFAKRQARWLTLRPGSNATETPESEDRAN